MKRLAAHWVVPVVLLLACGDSDVDAGAGGQAGAPNDGGAPAEGAGGTAGALEGGAPSNGGAPATGGAGGSGAGGAAGCLTDLSAGHHEVSCDGDILYDVEIPAACTSGGCGLIVDMHGYTMTGDAQDENTGMRALGQAEGYVVVQPTAPKDGFMFPSWDQAVHPPLVFAFLSALAEDLAIDPARIHAMGFSQGGGMTFRLLCSHADFFASGAPIAALPGCEFEGANVPSEEVDILQVHGRQDPIVSFQNQGVAQRDDALAAWPFGEPAIIEQDGGHTATRWTTASGTDYEFWEHDYTTSASAVFVAIGGHCVPGGADFEGTPAGYSCEDQDTFAFGTIAMQFFASHTK